MALKAADTKLGAGSSLPPQALNVRLAPTPPIGSKNGVPRNFRAWRREGWEGVDIDDAAVSILRE